ncbi:hypothetical protein [Sinimarinibacterium flocculans]|uniref:hypothetical protein n=1 Tax=Sinimarinibacterium flocculans TaxID=985250 RepID=UPI0035161CA3
MTNTADTIGQLAEEAPETIFEPRAEYLSAEELEKWTRLTTREQSLLRKLRGQGTKLLVGPRGCGKSTLMRLAYFSLLRTRDALPVYVNYSRSLALEPFFHTRADAIPLFRQWLLAKIVCALPEPLAAFNASCGETLQQLASQGDRLIRGLESGVFPGGLDQPLTLKQTIEELESLVTRLGVSRVVLLLDDAAHAFSSEQQREFFEVFRELRSRLIAPKAAIYPGITSFSPNFHVGHEAELIPAWFGVDDPGYIESMVSLVDRRLSDEMKEMLSDKRDVVEYFAYASFGLPRSFLNLLATVVGDGVQNSGQRPRLNAPRSVEANVQETIKVFVSLSAKLPKLKSFVSLGTKVLTRAIDALRRYNSAQNASNKKATVIAIEEPVSKNLERILHMLEYAGLVRSVGAVSRGEKGVFQRYSVHYGNIISENALTLGKSVSLRAVNEALSVRDAHAFVRVKGKSLLSDAEDSQCTVNLLPCPKCGTNRSFPEQRFCMKCGAELRDSSVYLDLLNTPVDLLPLPKAKIDGIKKHTSLRTVQNILMDDEKQELRKIPWVGAVWSKRIRTVAEEFVGV